MLFASNRRASSSARSLRTLALYVASASALPSLSLAQARTDSTAVGPGLVVAMGATGASRALIDSIDVQHSSATTLSELLQARAASVGVLMSGGTLTDGGRVLIRGPSTITTAGAPLLIVDGMRMAERQDEDARPELDVGRDGAGVGQHVQRLEPRHAVEPGRVEEVIDHPDVVAEVVALPRVLVDRSPDALVSEVRIAVRR